MALGEPLYKSEYIKMAPENKVSGQSVLPPFKQFSKGCIFSFTYWGPHLY
uniref:Uncharacterized protein n=1 Tax=Bos indicus x Bos taurus TaxID=30522 RepID=A0A4W2F1X7_BOBOX